MGPKIFASVAIAGFVVFIVAETGALAKLCYVAFLALSIVYKKCWPKRRQVGSDTRRRYKEERDDIPRRPREEGVFVQYESRTTEPGDSFWIDSRATNHGGPADSGLGDTFPVPRNPIRPVNILHVPPPPPPERKHTFRP